MAVGKRVELGGRLLAPGPFGGPVGGVDQAERRVPHGLGRRVVAQVGGEEGVDARGAHGVEEAVAGAAADGDGAQIRLRVAGHPDALRGGGEPGGGPGGEGGEGLGVVQFADPAESAPPSGSVGSGTRGPVIRRPRAPARASETPGSAVSALVCATWSAMSCLMRVWTTRPLKVSAATVVVPRR